MHFGSKAAPSNVSKFVRFFDTLLPCVDGNDIFSCQT